MNDNDSLYWIWLSEKCGVASREFSRLIGMFENPFEIYRLDTEEIGAIDGISERLKNALCSKSLEYAYSVLKYCKKNGVSIISYADRAYPQKLRTLEDPPVLLYCIGELPDLDRQVAVGIVGTRKMSAYGAQSAYKISYELASANLSIVSGMALGIDAVAACAALDAKGSTVAVLGCGIDIVYPRAHAKLKRFIENHGAVITEYPLGEPPQGKNFPKRNRIISGLSNGVFVVEGSETSGAMISARHAVSQGRDIFALPGNVDESNSSGPNELIKNGANVVVSSDDIVLYYDFLHHDVINYRGLKASRLHSDLDVKRLARYGVAADMCYVAEASAPVSDAVAPAEQPRTEAKPITAKRPECEAVSDEPTREDGTDNSAEILATLDTVTQRVFSLMPIDRAVAPDEFLSSGVGIAEAITALTMLELSGLCESLPGGTYIRK